MRLFHVSEDARIERFEPRPHETWPDLAPGVWAVRDTHLRNYLLPRDCPRVTFYALTSSGDDDVARYLDGNRDKAVVAVEEKWLATIDGTRLYLYEFDPASFDVTNEGAGYFRSGRTVEPIEVHEVQGLVEKIEEQGAEFRVLDNLWNLSDAIVESSLQFSMIRMRNAQGRPNGKPARFGRNV